MPDTISCPFCCRNLQLPIEVQGQAVQCPNCGQSFQTDTGASPPPKSAAAGDLPVEPSEHVTNRPPVGDAGIRPSLPAAVPSELDNLSAWQNVQRGVGLLYHGLVIGSIAVVTPVCGVCGAYDVSQKSIAEAVSTTIVIGLFIAGGLASITLHMVGQVYCLHLTLAPQARTFVRLSLSLMLLGLVLLQLAILGELAGTKFRTLTIPGGMGVLGAILINAQMIALVLYLRALALKLRLEKLARSACVLIGFFCGIVVSLFGIAGGSRDLSTSSWNTLDVVGAFCAVLLFILIPIVVAWYGLVLSALRGELNLHVRTLERQAR